jgi:hypothetical protein
MVPLLLAGMATSPQSPTDMSCIASAWPPTYAFRHLYPFSGGESGHIIQDGGNDMYDGGNEIRVRVRGQWSEPLKYTQVCHGEGPGEATRLGDVEFNTCKYSNTAPLFAAVFSSESAEIDGFRVNGNLGADGGGTQASSSAPISSATAMSTGTPMYGFYKSVSGTRDPSVNHLIIAPSAGVSMTGLTTDSDLHEIHFSQGVSIFVYLLWAGSSGYAYTENDFTSVYTSITTSCFGASRPIVFASPPPPRPDNAATQACAARPCGTEFTCRDFMHSPCSAAQDIAGCNCGPDCCNLEPPPPPPPPHRSPRAPSPAPGACSLPCAGSTCGAFSATGHATCYSLHDLGCDCSGCCVCPPNATRHST